MASEAQNSTGKWALQEFGGGLAMAIEGMAMASPELVIQLVDALPTDLAAPLFGWQQPLNGLDMGVYLQASEASLLATGQHVMLAAGIDDSSPEDLKSTFREVMGQAFSMMARAMTAKLQREVTPGDGAEASAAPDGVVWGAIELSWSATPVHFYMAMPTALLDVFIAAEAPPPAPVTAVAEKPSGEKAVAQAAGQSAGGAAPSTPASQNVQVTSSESKTYDLLLDVELPVSVSLGRAQVPLKDVLKLTTGSIIELSRAIVEPVDIIVNNCVIARGDVVVVEGNFGVRIQHVVSRSERLRTIQ
jgi:flagellar motor switch protein FliN